MGTVETLALWGVLRAPEVAELADAAGLPLAAAAALLEQESGGGRNVWGADAVPTGGAYVKGAEVTEQTYRAYRRALAAGTAGQQGVGPVQLTAVGYQDAADALGGCWLPRCSTTVGFRLLAGYMRRWDLPRAFRAYNGGAGTVTDPARYPSPAAHSYEQQAMGKYARWADRLGAGSTSTAPAVTEVDDMQPDERAALLEVRDGLRAAGIGKGRLPGRSAGQAQVVDDAFGWVLTGAGRADDAARGVDALRAQVTALVGAQASAPIDYQKLAAVLLPQLVAALAGR